MARTHTRTRIRTHLVVPHTDALSRFLLVRCERRLVDLYSCNYSATISQPLTTQLDLSPGLRGFSSTPRCTTSLPASPQSGAVQRCSVLLRPSTATCKVLLHLQQVWQQVPRPGSSPVSSYFRHQLLLRISPTGYFIDAPRPR